MKIFSCKIKPPAPLGSGAWPSQATISDSHPASKASVTVLVAHSHWPMAIHADMSFEDNRVPLMLEAAQAQYRFWAPKPVMLFLSQNPTQQYMCDCTTDLCLATGGGGRGVILGLPKDWPTHPPKLTHQPSHPDPPCPQGPSAHFYWGGESCIRTRSPPSRCLQAEKQRVAPATPADILDKYSKKERPSRVTSDNTSAEPLRGCSEETLQAVARELALDPELIKLVGRAMMFSDEQIQGMPQVCRMRLGGGERGQEELKASACALRIVCG